MKRSGYRKIDIGYNILGLVPRVQNYEVPANIIGSTLWPKNAINDPKGLKHFADLFPRHGALLE